MNSNALKITITSVLSLIFLSILLVIVYISKYARPCSFDMSFPVSKKRIINSTLIYNGLIFEEGDYYEDTDESIRICPVRHCQKHNKICVRKCCWPKRVIRKERDEEKCTESENRFLNFYDIDFSDVSNISENEKLLEIFVGVPECDYGYRGHDYVVSRNGLLKTVIINGNESRFQNPKFEYCVDFLHSNGSYEKYSYQCFPGNIKTSTEFFYYKYFLGASVVSFVITFLVYTFIPDLRETNRSLHGVCLMHHMGCLTVAYTALAFGQFFNFGNLYFGYFTCALLGKFNLFFINTNNNKYNRNL